MPGISQQRDAHEARALGEVGWRLLLLVGPFALANLVVVAFAPATAFTFRCWEQLAVGPLWFLIEGPFYPDQVVHRLEAGDLGHHTPSAVFREIDWVTDSQGFRNRPGPCVGARHIVAGDSTAAGTSLSQDDMLASVLERQRGGCFLTLAPLSPEQILRQLRSADAPADELLLVIAERTLSDFRAPDPATGAPKRRFARWYYETLGGTRHSVVFLDRLARGIPLQWARGALRRAIVRAFQGVGPSKRAPGPILFLSGKPQPDLDALGVQRIVDQFRQFQSLLAPSTRLVVVPVPEKETVLFDSLTPPVIGSRQLTNIVGALNAAGITAVELRTPFRTVVESRGLLPYQTDDSHWNALGVRLAAEAIAERLGFPAGG